MKPSSTSSCFALGTDVKTAFYQTVHRPEGDDFKWKLSEPVKVEGKTASVSHEFIELTLKLANGDVIKEHLFQVLPRPELTAKKPSRTGLDLNVLIFAMDSISNGHAQRKLPKSYGYIRDELQGYVFSGHSAVGDGTTEQLAALLSGRGEREQPEARRGNSHTRTSVYTFTKTDSTLIIELNMFHPLQTMVTSHHTPKMPRTWPHSTIDYSVLKIHQRIFIQDHSFWLRERY